MDTKLINATLRFNIEYAKQCVIDVKEDLMTFSPYPGLENHPSFTLGHLVSGKALVIRALNGDYQLPQNWKELFGRNGPGDPRRPESNHGQYPSKQDLLNELNASNDVLLDAIENTKESEMIQPYSWKYSSIFPNLKDMVWFMCSIHESMHLGQLAAWRRAVDLPSALARV